MSGRVEIKMVPKPWGYEKIWAHTDRYVGKILHISAGHALSVQYHDRKDETIHLLAGEMKYWVQKPEARGQRPEAGGESSRNSQLATRNFPDLMDVRLTAGESFRITPGTIHYMEAITDCDVLEVSTPELDDVVRLKDRYGREGTSAP